MLLDINARQIFEKISCSISDYTLSNVHIYKYFQVKGCLPTYKVIVTVDIVARIK